MMKGSKSNKVLNKINSKLSILIVMSMILTMILPHLSILDFNLPSAVYAAGTELKDESGSIAITEHSANSTMYYWGNSTYGWNSDERGYNVLGIKGKNNSNDTFFDGFDTCVYSGSGSGSPRLAGYTMDARLYNPENPMNDTDPYNSGTGASTNIGAGAANEKMTNGLVRTLTNVDDNTKKAEIKLKTSVSPDKRFVFLDLYAINLSSESQLFAFRCREDLSIQPDSVNSRVVMNDYNDSISVIGDSITSFTTSKFRQKNIVTRDNVYDLDPLNVKYYTGWSGYSSNTYKWAKNTAEPWNNLDAYLIFGWKDVEMGPYQRVHKRLAIIVRSKTFYVNSELGIDTVDRSVWTGLSDVSAYPPDTEWKQNTPSFPGAFDKPFKTVKYALQQLGTEKGYICIQNDCEVNDIIEVNNSHDITIQSTDLGINRLESSDIHELKVASNSYINMTGGNLTIQNLKINGQNKEDREMPFVNQTGGTLNFAAGSVVKNFLNKNGAAVVDCRGDNSVLGLYGVEVNSCKSGDKVETIDGKVSTTSCCAITYNGKIPSGVDSAGNDVLGLDMNGQNIINDNMNFENKKANIYLGDGRFIQVSNLLENEKTGGRANISVTTEKLPDAYIGAVTKATEEILIAKPTNTYPNISGIANCPFEELFSDDRTAANNRIEIAEGKVIGGANAKKNVVVKQLGSRISFKYVRDDGIAMQGLSREDMIKPVGDFLVIEATPSKITGFEMDRCQVIGNGFVIDNNKESPTFGTAQGTVGTGNVEIRYIYKAQNVVFSFAPNGGTPDHIPNIEGQASKRVSGVLSKLTKYGYLFAGWYDNIDDPYDTGDTGKITSLPQTFPNESKKYYAKYNIDPNISIPVSENHTNLDGSIIFYETPDSEVYPPTGNRNVESAIGFPSRAIPGYRPKIADSLVTPATYVYRSNEEPVGTFTPGTGNAIEFNGKTPGQQTLVTFKYEPDDTEYTFRREFYKVNSAGTNPQPISIGGNTYVESPLHAEDLIDYTPGSRDGFNIIGASVTAGDTEDLPNYIYKVTGSFDQYNSYKYTGKMPNQNVTIEYYYQSTANDKEFIVDWNDVTSNDDRNRNIVDTFIEEHSFEDAISADKRTDLYGYVFNGNEVDPATAGTFDGNNHFSGTMPLNQAVTVTYKYTRDPNYFKDIVYKPSLEETGCTTSFDVTDLSPDLTINGDGNPTTQVLINSADGTGWTFDNLNTRELMPRVSVNDQTLYAVNSFFVDKNGNQIYDEGTDRMLTNDSVFTTSDMVGGVITIVPHVEVLFSNISISFASDGNAPIDTTGIETNYRSIDTWQTAIDTGIPNTSTAGYYYTFDAWYLNNIKVQATDLLVNGGEYIAKFVKDTSMADAPKKVLYTTSIDSSGNGQINLRDLHSGYIYILADTDDKVKAKALATNTALSFNHATDGVHVNTTYHLYEMLNAGNIFDTINIDDVVTSIGDASDRSQASICYVPAVLKNYTVSVDTSAMTSGSTDVAKVTIKPTSTDYSYKILDGTTTICDWQSGSVNGITFEGLTPGKNYKLVTKNNLGEESTSTGTNLYIDTLYNLTENSYVVTVINGTVNGGGNTAIVDSGSQVNIQTTEAEGEFKWVSVLGGASLASATSQTTTFTMPAKNVIVQAKKNVPDTNKIKISAAQYGIDDYNIYMDSSDEMNMINSITTNAERYLSNHNFNISYKVTYNKDLLTFEEQTALEGSGGAATGTAARGAVAINVDVDRYIDNKRVDPNDFNPDVPPLTGSSLMGTGTEDITALFGEGILNKVPGLEEYLNGENQQPTDANEPTITVSNNDEEPEGDETTTAIEETTAVEETTNVGASSASPAEETTTAVVASSENTTEESTTIEETTTEESTTTTEATEAEETEATEATVGGFTGTEIVEASDNGQGIGQELNYEELIDNLMLFGSNFGTDLSVKTYVTLPNYDLNNGEYTVYESNGTSLNVIPSVLDNYDDAGKKGLIAFTAVKGKRYIIAYNRYNDVVVVNNNPGISVASPSAIVRFEKRVKYGDNISAYAAELPTLDGYSYNRATYQNGEFSYKSNEKVQFNLTDAIIAPMTIYVVYDTDAASIEELMAGINAALARARRMLDNYFLLLIEKNDITAKVNTLETLVADDTSVPAQLLTALTELEAVLDDVEPKLTAREVDYQKQDVKKNQTSSTPTSGSSYSGGGSRGGGGGGAAAQGQAAVAAGPGAMNALTPELEATALGVNAAALPNAAQNMAAQNVPNVPASVTSKTGMTKISFNENVSSFVKADGSLAKSEWIETNYGWYHANTSGALDTGWAKFGNDWFYFNETNVNNGKNLMHTGWLQSTTTAGTNTYYMAANGSMMTGYQTINGLTYYFDPISGTMLVNTTAPDGRAIGADGVVR